MRRSTWVFLALSVFAILGAGRAAAQPLVTVDWLKTNLKLPGLLVLDVRSGAGRTKADYLAGHIPGAVFTDYAKDGWRERTKEGVESQLPSAEKLEKVVGSLGIGNDTHVILIPEGRAAQDVAAATRIYWTLKVLGHDKVSILDGGHLAWVRDIDKATQKPVNPLETADVRPEPKLFKANWRPHMIATRADVQSAIAARQPLVDNRPADFFVGVTKSPAAKRAGTLPGAISLPEGWLTRNNGGLFRSKEQLTKLYQAAGVSTTGKQINFCNTGHWASLGWFVSSELMGNKDARMYPGSLADWTSDPSAPVEQKVSAD